MTQNTPKDIVLEVEERFDRTFNKGNYWSFETDEGVKELKAFMLREISAAEERVVEYIKGEFAKVEQRDDEENFIIHPLELAEILKEARIIKP